MHFYLFPAFTHKRFEESRVCKKLSPHLHQGELLHFRDYKGLSQRARNKGS